MSAVRKCGKSAKTAEAPRTITYRITAARANMATRAPPQIPTVAIRSLATRIPYFLQQIVP